jgi:DNA-directed RNA polymerase specialized sigma24 family protein
VITEDMALDTKAASFTEFFAAVQPRLRHALAAALGGEIGVEAAQEALVWGWEHWDELREMDNPAGYLYRVGRSRSRRFQRRTVRLPVVQPSNPVPWVEPGLPRALERLSEKHRASVVLVHSMGWTYAETAEMLGVTIGTVQTHAERGLARLRKSLGGEV